MDKREPVQIHERFGRQYDSLDKRVWIRTNHDIICNSIHIVSYMRKGKPTVTLVNGEVKNVSGTWKTGFDAWCEVHRPDLL